MWIVKLVQIAPWCISQFYFKRPGLKKHQYLVGSWCKATCRLASEPPGGSHGGAHGAALSDGQSLPMQPNWSDSLCAWAIDVFPNRLALISKELSSVKWVSWLLATGHIQRMDICRRRKMSIHAWVKRLDIFVVADFCQLRIKVVIAS